MIDLEQLFNEAFMDEKLQAKFYYEILHSFIYVLGEEKEAMQDDETSELKIVTLRQNEESFVPVFLSQESMENFLNGEEQPFLKALGMDLLETLKKNNLVINPGREDSIVIYADEVQYILSQGKN